MYVADESSGSVGVIETEWSYGRILQ
jgi:hypothetical protein